jgi:hypothetical protein
VLFTHAVPVPHVLPQLPQFEGSLVVSVQMSPQQVPAQFAGFGGQMVA